MKTIFNILLIFGLAVFAARAQYEVPPPMPASTPMFTDAQLQQLLGPIALYPDPLIAIMLPAATLPTQIVLADRYVSGGGDPSQIEQQPWDPNVQALAHYPEVLKWMDNNLNWTTQLGEAFQNQQQDVMNAIQELRTQAYNLGNLQSTPQQQVINNNGYIEILPANPNNIYVPQYQPTQVFYYQPVYGTSFVIFGTPFVTGRWLCGDFDWRNRHMIFWDHDHPRPDGWWHQRPDERAHFIDAGHARVWSESVNRPVNTPAYRGDRGYNNNLPWTTPAAAAKGNHPAPAPVPAERNNAFIGIQSTHDTRDYSNRGEHSMQTMPQFRDLGGFHGGTPPPSAGVHGGNPPPSGAHSGAPGTPAGGGYHGAPAGGVHGAPAGGGSRPSQPQPPAGSGGGGGGGRH